MCGLRRKVRKALSQAADSKGCIAAQVSCPADLVPLLQADNIQFTLVDCPGHASLLKTVLAGAHVLDVMILVVDCCKGIQVRTPGNWQPSHAPCPLHSGVTRSRVQRCGLLQGHPGMNPCQLAALACSMTPALRS